MAELRISQASQDALKARLATPEGKEALNDLAQADRRVGVRGDAAGLAGVAGDEEGMAAFREAWPDIVDAFLFRRGSKPAAASWQAKRGQEDREAATNPGEVGARRRRAALGFALHLA